MILNNVMTMLEAWSFGEYEVSPHYHCSYVHEYVAPARVQSMDQIKLLDI